MEKIKNHKKKNYDYLKRWCSVFAQTFGICLLVILVVCPISCHITTEGIEFLGGDFVSPKIENCKVVDSQHILLEFTETVTLQGLSVGMKNEDFNSFDEDGNKLIEVNAVKGDDGRVIVELNKSTEIGKDYILGGVVEDKYGNSLTFSIPFIGYNNQIPDIIITEFFNETTTPNSKNLCRNEYIKFLALEDGNLFGLAIGSGTWKDNFAYYFPAINVKKGEEFIVHFNVKGDGCISELNGDLDLAYELTSEKGIRDLWLDNTKSVFGNGNDVVFVKDILNDKIIDGFTYNDRKKNQWSDEIKIIAKLLEENNVYNSSLYEDGCFIGPVSSTNPLMRVNKNMILGQIKDNIKIQLPLKTSKEDWKPKKELQK